MSNLLRLQLVSREAEPEAQHYEVFLLWRSGGWTRLSLGAHESEQRARWMAMDMVLALLPDSRPETFFVSKTKVDEVSPQG